MPAGTSEGGVVPGPPPEGEEEAKKLKRYKPSSGRKLEFWTANANGSWATAERFLKNDVEAAKEKGVLVVGLQEVGLASKAWVAEKAAALAKKGWRRLASPAQTTAKGGVSVGAALVLPTAVGVKKVDGQRDWDIFPAVGAGRLVMAVVQTQGLGWLLVLVGYFVTGENLVTPRNAALLTTAAKWICSSGLPFIVLVDWQNPFEALAALPWLDVWRADIKATEEGTCKCFKTGRKSKIDYMVVDRRVKQAFGDPRLAASDLSPHTHLLGFRWRRGGGRTR